MSADDSNVTRPTLETILERINSLDERLDSRINGLEARMNARLDGLDIKLDRVGSVAHATRAETLELRADFRELNKRLQEHFPAVS